MDFWSILAQVDDGIAENPFAGRNEAGDWIPGLISIAFLQQHFGQFSTATEMQAATESEGLKAYFEWLAENGVIPQ